MTTLLTKILLRNLISFLVIVCALSSYHMYIAEYVLSIAHGTTIDAIIHIALGMIFVLTLIGDSIDRLAWMLPLPIISLYATWLLEGAQSDAAYHGLHWVFIAGFSLLFWLGGLLAIALSSAKRRKGDGVRYP